MIMVQGPIAPLPLVSSNFQIYERLVRSWLPRLHTLAVHGPAGETIYSSDSYLSPDYHAVVETLTGAEPPAEWIRRELPDGRHAYGHALVHEGRRVGALIVTVKADARGGEKIHTELLTPLAECVARELALAQRLEDAESRARAGDSLLKSVRAVADQDAAPEPLEQLVAAAKRDLGAHYAFLYVPAQRRVVWSGPDAEAHAGVPLAVWNALRRKPRPQRLGVPNGPENAILAAPVFGTPRSLVGVLGIHTPTIPADVAGLEESVVTLHALRVARVLDHEHDALTGLASRAAFERRAGELVRANRGNVAEPLVLYADIDQMHVVNELGGNALGDEVLALLARAMRAAVPADGLVARLGGDRFGMLFAAARASEVEKLANLPVETAKRLRISISGQPHTLSVSVGGCLVTRADGFPEALTRAEIACRAAKDRGRGRAELYVDGDASMIRRRTAVHTAAQLHAALRNNQFELVAQPIRPLVEEGAPWYHEVLLRMVDERGGTVAPDKFLAAAGTYGLLPAIDRWVVHRVLHLLAQGPGTFDPTRTRFSINLAGATLAAEGFVEFLRAQLEATRIAPELLCFELAEPAVMQQTERSRQFFLAIKGLGCTVALDDFGSGETSLASLQKLPLDFVKLDGSIIRTLQKNRVVAPALKSAVEIARGLHLRTIAEYVETGELESEVRKLGIDYGQGFAIGRPRAFDAALEELRQPASDEETG